MRCHRGCKQQREREGVFRGCDRAAFPPARFSFPFRFPRPVKNGNEKRQGRSDFRGQDSAPGERSHLVVACVSMGGASNNEIRKPSKGSPLSPLSSGQPRSPLVFTFSWLTVPMAPGACSSPRRRSATHRHRHPHKGLSGLPSCAGDLNSPIPFRFPRPMQNGIEKMRGWVEHFAGI
jgi:hypothetical protein